MPTVHKHSFSFGEETCEICGVSFIEAGDALSAFLAHSNSATECRAVGRADHPRNEKPRPSLFGLFAHLFRRIHY